MKKPFKFLVISMLVVMLVSILGGCTTTDDDNQATSVTVTDMAGREVEIPVGIKKIATVYGGATNLLISAGASDLIAALNPKSDFAKLVNPDLANAGFIGKGKVDYEALANLQPDLFVHKSSDLETLEAVQALGIPAIGIYLEDQDDIKTSLELIGKALGMEKEVAAKIKYYDKLMDQAAELVEDVEEGDKPKAIVMGSDIGKVADGNMLQSYMMLTAGAINPAKDVVTTNIWPVVGVEEIFDWNPDYIFVTGSSSNTYTVDDLKADSAWSEVEAIKNDHVYLVPCSIDSWEFPGVGSALGTLWMVKTMYPSLLSDEDFDKTVIEFYDKIYGIDVDATILGY